MKKIILIVPYFGKWPVWFDAHLLSIKENPTIDWLFYTDCGIPTEAPSNCTFIKSSLKEMETLFSTKIEVPIHIDKPYKLCDIKPSYGHVFEDDIKEYDFWGFTDIDIIWGNIRNQMNKGVLNTYDVISSRKGLISGHFNLFRNEDRINKLYRKNDWYKQSFTDCNMKRFCEGTFSDITKEALKEGSIKVEWDKILCNKERGRDSHQEYYLDKWLWQDGRVLELEKEKPVKEVMYLHFINWKRTMKFCEVEYKDNPKQFYISYTRMHYKPHSHFAKALNRFKNLFDGFYIREGRRIRKLKRKSLKKRVVNKINKILGWK